jgi:hypothetical protein
MFFSTTHTMQCNFMLLRTATTTESSVTPAEPDTTETLNTTAAETTEGATITGIQYNSNTVFSHRTRLVRY